MKHPQKLVVSILGCQLVGIAGTPFTLSSIPDWYMGLTKPWFAPPNWLFGPAWTLLYFLMGVAVYLIWTQKPAKKAALNRVKLALKWFLIQLILNGIWSPIFFGLRSPELGLLIIVVMWLAIAATIKQFFGVSRTAGYLLLPYLAWVSFATVLNFSIVVLN